MYKHRNVLMLAAVICLAAVLLTACTTSMSYTFSVETGDQVEVKLNTSDGLKMTQSDGQFSVLDADGQHLLDGGFVTAEGMDYYRSAMYTEGAEVLLDTDEEILWTYDGEYNRLVMVNDRTGVLIGSLMDPETAENAYQQLTITLRGS